MPFMKAIQISSPGGEFELVQKEIPEPKPNEVLIKVEACGICHGDAVVKEGYYPGLKYPRIPGHEVVGIIQKLGSKMHWRVGQRVGVGWRGGYCYSCPACANGKFWACQNPKATGITVDGGYAEYMVAQAEALTAIPDGISSVEVAPLLCAGTTTLGALKSCSAKGGDLVAIHGFGGLGHLALQFAVKLGFDTVVLSRGTVKEALARKLGAHHYIDTTVGDPANELMKLGGARVILCTAPNSKSIAELINGLGRNGQMILITFVNEPLKIIPAFLMRNVTSISGWVGGNIEDTLRFSLLTKVIPMIEVFPLEQAALAFERMMTAKVHFRAVLKMGDENHE